MGRSWRTATIRPLPATAADKGGYPAEKAWSKPSGALDEAGKSDQDDRANEGHDDGADHPAAVPDA